MSLWEYLWAGSAITKWLYHLNWDANDSSGNGNNWTASNVTRVDWKIGSLAGSFNGSSSQIQTANNWWITGALTISCWCKADVLTNNYISVAWQRSNAPNNRWYYYVWVRYDSINLNAGFGIGNTAGNTVLANSWVLLSTNVRYNLVWTFTWDTTTNWIKIYINWEFKWQTTFVWSVPTTTYEHYIGCARNWWVVDRFDWIIDEVIIENRAWTPVEVQKYYTNAKWRFWIL